MPELEPYRSLDASRLVLHGEGKWDATQHLSEDLAMAYREPLLIQMPSEPSVYPDFSDSQEAVAELAKVWDKKGLLLLHRGDHGPQHPGECTKVFNVYKNVESDRQIGDRRGKNSQEYRVEGPSLYLPSGADLMDLQCDANQQHLSVSITDRRDFYHQIWTSRSKALANTVAPAVDLALLRETAAYQELTTLKRSKYDRRVHGDRLLEAASFGLCHMLCSKASVVTSTSLHFGRC